MKEFTSLKQKLKEKYKCYLFSKHNNTYYDIGYENGYNLAKLIKSLNYHESNIDIKLYTDFHNNQIKIHIDNIQSLSEKESFNKIYNTYDNYQLSFAQVRYMKHMKPILYSENNYQRITMKNGFIKGFYKIFGHFHHFRYFNGLSVVFESENKVKIELFK